MMRHILKFIWNRKRANALIMLELVVAFLILFALTCFTLNLYRLYARPLGFRVENVWTVSIATGGSSWSEADDTRFAQVQNVLQQFDEVAAVERMNDRPFSIGGSAMSTEVDGVNLMRVGMNIVSQGLPQALDMKLVEGRWFGPEDDRELASEERITPVLVNRAFSDALGGNVVGKYATNGPDWKLHIVGVIEEFRQQGEFSAVAPFLLMRMRAESNALETPSVVLILKPGVTADFEERLLAVLQQAAPGWDFTVDAWEALQDSHFRLYTIPLMIAGGLVAFLLAMVGFGMLGVLWQNVIRRTPEMGVRRALGATAGAVRLQVVLELLAMAVFSLVLGIAIVVQVPLSGILQSLDWKLFLPSVVVTSVLLLGLCILFALYPSYQATRQDPVEALRYE